jgi:hypothetical protein
MSPRTRRASSPAQQLDADVERLIVARDAWRARAADKSVEDVAIEAEAREMRGLAGDVQPRPARARWTLLLALLSMVAGALAVLDAQDARDRTLSTLSSLRTKGSRLRKVVDGSSSPRYQWFFRARVVAGRPDDQMIFRWDDDPVDDHVELGEWDRSDRRRRCRALVHRAGVLVFGGPGTGYLECDVDERGIRRAWGVDARSSRLEYDRERAEITIDRATEGRRTLSLPRR